MTRGRGALGRRLALPVMLAGLVGLASLAAASPARADTVDDRVTRGRALYDRGDFTGAHDELLAAYQLEPRPELLFALGQVELHLGHFAQAIDYYERFIATEPAADQVALAQQAIGAARARLTEKPPPPSPPRPPPHRQWDRIDSALAAAGGAAVLAGGGLVAWGLHAAGDHSGTLSTYNHRLSQSTFAQWAGAGCLAAGALAIGGAVLRWRLHLVDGEIQPIAGPGTAGASWVGRW